jgi:hypothetical protein
MQVASSSQSSLRSSSEVWFTQLPLWHFMQGGQSPWVGTEEHTPNVTHTWHCPQD